MSRKRSNQILHSVTTYRTPRAISHRLMMVFTTTSVRRGQMKVTDIHYCHAAPSRSATRLQWSTTNRCSGADYILKMLSRSETYYCFLIGRCCKDNYNYGMLARLIDTRNHRQSCF